MTAPANIGFMVSSIRLMKKKKNRHFVIPEAPLAFILHEDEGSSDWSLLIKVGVQNRRVTCGTPACDDWRKGSRRGAAWWGQISAEDTAGLLMCCNKAARGLLVQLKTSSVADSLRLLSHACICRPLTPAHCTKARSYYLCVFACVKVHSGEKIFMYIVQAMVVYQSSLICYRLPL